MSKLDKLASLCQGIGILKEVKVNGMHKKLGRHTNRNNG